MAGAQHRGDRGRQVSRPPSYADLDESEVFVVVRRWMWRELDLAGVALLVFARIWSFLLGPHPVMLLAGGDRDPAHRERAARGGEEVPLSEARPGDILWRDGHVAFYVGGNSYIHAPKPGDVVREATGVSYFTCAVRYR